jgi:hypothetical protein
MTEPTKKEILSCGTPRDLIDELWRINAEHTKQINRLTQLHKRDKEFIRILTERSNKNIPELAEGLGISVPTARIIYERGRKDAEKDKRIKNISREQESLAVDFLTNNSSQDMWFVIGRIFEILGIEACSDEAKKI